MQQHRKTLLLLGVIYLAFVSLGLPDGVLGVAWPWMRADMAKPLESVGVITTALLALSALSSVLSGRLITRFGTGGLTFLSGLVTGLALLGYAAAPSFLTLVLLTIPLGLGQGAVDSGLNLYVAAHYSARHMNWLHCFWGVGASLGPFLMTRMLSGGFGWRRGYAAVAAIQLCLSACLLISLISGLWSRGSVEDSDDSGGPERTGSLSAPLHQGAAVFLFFLYAGIEFSSGIWINSVLVESRGFPVQVAGYAVTAYYGCVMAGRFLSGTLVGTLGNMRMIRIGMALGVAGGILCALSSGYAGIFVGVALLGLGLSPVYPCLMHETPARFTPPVFRKLVGYQVGAACLGGSVVSAGLGILLSRLSLELLFPLVAAMLVLALALNEFLHRTALRKLG